MALEGPIRANPFGYARRHTFMHPYRSIYTYIYVYIYISIYISIYVCIVCLECEFKAQPKMRRRRTVAAAKGCGVSGAHNVHRLMIINNE